MNTKINSDHIGVVLSCTCLVHCITLPFVLVAFNSAIEESVIHTMFFIAAIAITGHAVYHSYKKHCKHLVLFFAFLGLGMLGLDVLLEYMGSHDHSGHNHAPGIEHGHIDDLVNPQYKFETLSIIGSILLIATHLINLYYGSKAKHTTCGGCK